MAYFTLSDFKDEVANTQYIQADLATDTQLQSAIDRASNEADDYLRSAGYDLPLVAWGKSFQGKVLDIAIYWLASSTLMMNVQDIRTTTPYINYKWAIEWFEGVVEGRITPDITDSDATNDESTVDTRVFVLGNQKRGW